MANVPSAELLTQQLTTAVDLIDETVNQHLFATNPYRSIITRGVYDPSRGLNQTAMTFEGTLPTEYPTFVELELSDGTADDACDPASQVIQMGQTERPYTMEVAAFHTHMFCITDLMFSHQMMDQIRGSENVIANFLTTWFADRSRLKNIAMCDFKCSVIDPQPFEFLTNQLTNFGGNTAPTARLDWQHLDVIYDELTSRGKGYATPIRGEGGEVVFPIFFGPMIKRLLFREIYTRTDVAFTSDAPLNFRSRGTNKAFRGYFPVIDPFPLRYGQYEGGIGSLIYPFRNVATTHGWKHELNPAWQPHWKSGGEAYYEVAYVYTPGVYEDLVRPPDSTQAARMRFSPQNYVGDISFINNKDMEHNPRGNKGYYNVDVQMAAHPLDPQAGVSVIFTIPTLAEIGAVDAVTFTT